MMMAMMTISQEYETEYETKCPWVWIKFWS